MIIIQSGDIIKKTDDGLMIVKRAYRDDGSLIEIENRRFPEVPCVILEIDADIIGGVMYAHRYLARFVGYDVHDLSNLLLLTAPSGIYKEFKTGLATMEAMARLIEQAKE